MASVVNTDTSAAIIRSDSMKRSRTMRKRRPVRRVAWGTGGIADTLAPETIALMKDDKAAREAMGKLSGTDLAGFEAQLETTNMFYTPKEALAFTTGPDLPKIMDLVRTFSFEHNLLGENVASPDVVGIETPAGVLGDKNNIKLRFDPTYMQMAADGKL